MTIYYVSNTFGNDAWNGQAKKFVSGSTGPKKTTAAARLLINAAVAGDQILFARGEAWTNAALYLIQAASPTALNPVVIGDYSHDDAPTVQTGTTTSVGASTLTDTSKSGTWTTNSEVGKSVETWGFNGSAEYFIVASNTSTQLTFTKDWGARAFYNTPYTLQARRPSLTDTRDRGVGGTDNAIIDLDVGGTDAGYVVRNLEIYGGGGTNAQWGVFLSGNVRDVTLQNLYIDGCSIGVYAGVGNLRYQLIACFITNCFSQGVIWSSNDSIVELNTFDNNADDGADGRDHNYYSSYGIFDDPSGPRNLTFRFNTSVRNAQSDGTSGSVAMVFHGNVHGMRIYGNYLYQTVASASSGGYGIAVDSGNYTDDLGHPTVEGFFDLVISDNIVVNMAQNCIDVSFSLNALIENNICVIEQGCQFQGMQGIVAAVQQTPNGISQATTGTVIRNNSFYCDSGTYIFGDISLISFGEGDSNGNTAGTNNVCANNLLIYGPNVSVASGGYQFIKYGSRASGDFTFIGNNLVYQASGVARYSSGTNLSYSNMAAAKAAGIETGGVNADPLLVAVPSLANGWSMAVQGGSPSIGAGNNTHRSRLAFRGYPVSGTRNIGAL